MFVFFIDNFEASCYTKFRTKSYKHFSRIYAEIRSARFYRATVNSLTTM